MEEWADPKILRGPGSGETIACAQTPAQPQDKFQIQHLPWVPDKESEKWLPEVLWPIVTFEFISNDMIE